MFEPTHPTGWARAVLAAIALALIVVVTSALPANAHDQILSTTPADGEHSVTAPSDVTLRFTDTVLALGAMVLVVDNAGENWADGAVRLEEAEATAPLKPALPDGAYQVRWRVVSADGHPISGTFAFSVGIVTSEPAPASAPAPSATTAVPADDEPSAAVTTSSGGMPMALVALIGAGSGVALFALVSFFVRRRTSRR